MAKTGLVIATLALAMMSINSQACAAPATLNGLGLTAQTAAVVNNGTCQNYFSAGACATPWSVISTLNTQSAWLTQQAINANNYELQFVNASVYFAQQQGWINNSTSVPSSSTSFWSSVGNWFTNLWNRSKALFQTFSSWVQTLFSKAGNAVNPCFQAWANLTNGAYCVSSSNSSLTASLGLASGSSSLWMLNADINTTGNALQACLPLIDNYCSLTYGVSVSNSGLPFNVTFNWTDGGVSNATCNGLQTVFNQTATVSGLLTLNTLLVELFQTNWIRFVPSAAAITNLGSFLSGNAASSTFVPTQQVAPTTAGIAFSGVAGGENIYADGLLSGQPKTTYGSAVSYFTAIMIPLLALLL
jgi:hypothetical protein